MKKLLFLTLFALMLAFGFAFKTVNKNTANEHANAVVNQTQGVFIFLLAAPTSNYDVLGTVKKTVAWSGKPKEMLNGIIKKSKKDFPQCEGIIFDDVEMDHATAIKFK